MQVKLWKIKVSNRSPAGEWKIPAGQGANHAQSHR